jgi:hypothetical protein
VEEILSCETYVASDATVRVSTVTGLSCDGSTLSISAESADSQYVSIFVKNLSQLGIFSDISYTGYSKSSEVYTYTVSAVFVSHTYTEDEDGTVTEVTP